MHADNEARVRLVVPTLGQRVGFLAETLASIRDQGVAVDLVVVCPEFADAARDLARRAGARWVKDPGSLPGAINLGMSSGGDVPFVAWLGDDDLLTPGSLATTTTALENRPDAVLAYGACRYIDASCRLLWTSRAGVSAQKILSWGPQLIPQPGMLVRHSAWNSVGGVDESFSYAFDFDLLLKLRSEGPFIVVPEVVSAFRWHLESLTVADRSANLDESERAKRRYLSARQRQWAWLWERPVRVATRVAAGLVNRRAQRLTTGRTSQ